MIRIPAFLLKPRTWLVMFPNVLRETYVNPYALMVFPCILTWGAAMWLLLRAKPGDLKEVFSGGACPCEFPARIPGLHPSGSGATVRNPPGCFRSS